MSDSIISVESLGKRYRIWHQRQNSTRYRYKALRDVLTDKSRSVARRLWSSIRFPGAERSKLNNQPSSEDFWALKNVSFEIKPGEVVGIIGRNGAGKSTLLKILSRITEPTEGRVRIRGRVASLLEVGTGFHPELTGRENIFLNGSILGMSRTEIKRKFDQIVAFAEVETFLDTPVKRYSSGMYVRLAFAVAAHLEPEILIVDEVLAVGDAEFQKKCLGKIQDVSRSGRTVLFVSHNMGAVRNLCGRGLLIVGGQKGFDGSAERAITEYASCNPTDSNLSWSRPHDPARPRISFESIQVKLLGQQPQLRLMCSVVLQSIANGDPVFIAVDICDPLQTPIMQALPAAKPFIASRTGKQQLLLEIDLPPLIPGHYIVDFWIGSHFSSTVDYVKSVVTFEVAESPSADRFFPHSPNHGFVAPLSRCECLSI